MTVGRRYFGKVSKCDVASFLQFTPFLVPLPPHRCQKLTCFQFSDDFQSEFDLMELVKIHCRPRYHASSTKQRKSFAYNSAHLHTDLVVLKLMISPFQYWFSRCEKAVGGVDNFPYHALLENLKKIWQLGCNWLLKFNTFVQRFHSLNINFLSWEAGS